METILTPSFPAVLELTLYGDPISLQSLQVRKLVDTVATLFRGTVQPRYRHFPNPDEERSLLAAFALESAHRQGQFGSMFRAISAQPMVTPFTLVELAQTLGLNEHQFMRDLLDDRTHRVIKADWQAGYTLGVRTSPTVVVGGHRFHGKLTLARLTPVIRHHISQLLVTPPPSFPQTTVNPGQVSIVPTGILPSQNQDSRSASYSDS